MPPCQIDFVIVTPLAEERDAILARLPGHRKLPPAEDDIRVYYAADIPVRFPDGTEARYAITVVPLAKMGHTEAASATGDAVRRWQPRYVVLVGIAGGLAQAGVQLGDVLISDQVADYELQKITAGQPVYRWQVHQADQRLLIAAQNFTARDWEHTAARRPNRRRPQVHFGPLCTGNKVIADDSLTGQFREVWAKLIGVEMEAGGVANAVAQTARTPGFFMIRGVSDLADGRKDSRRVKSWRPYACEIAAAYAIEFLKSGPVPAAEKGAAVEPKPESGARADKPAASLSLPGPVRVQLCQRPGDKWRDLAEYLEIPPHDQAHFERGDEGRSLWTWLDNRRRLAELPAASAAIGRQDLADLLLSGGENRRGALG